MRITLLFIVFLSHVTFGQSWTATWIPNNQDCQNLFLANEKPENNLLRFILFDHKNNADSSLQEIQHFVNQRYNQVVDPEYSIEVLQVWYDDLGNVDVIETMISDNVALRPDNFELNDIPKSFQTDLRNIETSFKNNVLFEEIEKVFQLFKSNSSNKKN